MRPNADIAKSARIRKHDLQLLGGQTARNPLKSPQKNAKIAKKTAAFV
jgi:hypothetical protein